MSRRRTLMIAVPMAVAALAGSAPSIESASAQIGCTAVQDIKFVTFSSRVCDMPDYDQRRRMGTIMGDGRTFGLVGLLNNGRCHCVPTSVTDLLGYYAHKGVDIAPGSYPWWSRPGVDEFASNDSPSSYLALQPYPTQEVFKYNDASNLIFQLGQSVVVDEDTCGTSYQKVVSSFQSLPASTVAFLQFGISDTNAATGLNIANTMASGGLVSVAYGSYEDYERNGSIVEIGDRVGGHVIAVTSIKGGLKNMTLGYNDPNNDATQDQFRQAQFATSEVALKRLVNPPLTVAGLGWFYRFGPDSDTATQRLIDKYMAVYPLALVAGKGSKATVVTGFNLNRQDSTQHPLNISIPPKPKPKLTGFKVKGELIDAVPMPMSGEIAYIESGSDVVKAIVPETRVRRTLGRAPAGAKDLDASPTGKSVFVLGRKSVVTLGREGGVAARRVLDEPAAAIAYDWSHAAEPWKQRLGVVSAADRRLTLLRPDTLKPTKRIPLPKRLLRGKGGLTAGFGPDGRLRVRAGDGSVRILGGAVRQLPGTNGGFATMDQGTMLATQRGEVRSIGGDSPFDGLDLQGARVLSVTHTGGDFTPAQADDIIDETTVEPGEGEQTPPPTATPTPTPTATPTPTPTATPTPDPSGLPNLVVDSATGTEAVIRNAGETAAGPFTSSLTQGSGPPLTFDTAGLAAGETTTLTYGCRRQELRSLTVDSANRVAESNEGDNTRRFTSDC